MTKRDSKAPKSYMDSFFYVKHGMLGWPSYRDENNPDFVEQQELTESAAEVSVTNSSGPEMAGCPDCGQNFYSTDISGCLLCGYRS